MTNSTTQPSSKEGILVWFMSKWTWILTLLNRDVKADQYTPPPPVPLWVLLLFISITIFLVLVTIIEQRIPYYIYLFAAFGTIAYIFTNLATNQVRTFTPLQAIARICAAPPVAAGVYILSPIIFDIRSDDINSLALVVFLAGFSMEVFVQTFNSVAHRLLGLPEPSEEDVIRLDKETISKLKSEADKHKMSDSEYLNTILENHQEHNKKQAKHEEQIEKLKQENTQLRKQLTSTNQNIDQHQDHIQSLENQLRYHRAGLVTRAKWWLLGEHDRVRTK